MAEEEKNLLIQEMQRQHILHGGGLGRPMVDGSMRLKMSPPFDTGTASGTTGGMGRHGGGTPQPMNLGQGIPKVPTQVPRPQVPQVPNGGGFSTVRGGVGDELIPPGVPRQQQVQPQVRPDDSRLGTPTQGRAFPAFNRTPLPPQPTNTQLPNPMLGTSRNVPGMDYRPPPPPTPQEKNIFGMPQGGDQGRFGMTGFFNRMFNDPARMAMLSGGLTALDPNAYYDKEGFGSPWTGLRAGLGGAQAGYKSVIDRRKAEAETALAKAKTTAEGQAKAPDVKSAQFGDHVYLYTDEAVEAVTKQIMRDEGLTREQAQRKAIPIAGTRMQKEVTPQQAIKNEKVRLKTQGRARMKLKELDNLEMLLRKSPIAGGELGGSLMDLVNIMSENILNKTAYKDRAEIDSIVDRMRPLLTKEFIEESRMSDYERQIVNEALGYTGVSSAKKKLRALPLIQRMLRETAGMTRQETTGGIVDKKEAYKKAFPNLPM